MCPALTGCVRRIKFLQHAYMGHSANNRGFIFEYANVCLSIYVSLALKFLYKKNLMLQNIIVSLTKGRTRREYTMSPELQSYASMHTRRVSSKLYYGLFERDS